MDISAEVVEVGKQGEFGEDLNVFFTHSMQDDVTPLSLRKRVAVERMCCSFASWGMSSFTVAMTNPGVCVHTWMLVQAAPGDSAAASSVILLWKALIVSSEKVDFWRRIPRVFLIWGRTVLNVMTEMAIEHIGSQMS